MSISPVLRPLDGESTPPVPNKPNAYDSTAMDMCGLTESLTALNVSSTPSWRLESSSWPPSKKSGSSGGRIPGKKKEMSAALPNEALSVLSTEWNEESVFQVWSEVGPT